MHSSLRESPLLIVSLYPLLSLCLGIAACDTDQDGDGYPASEDCDDASPDTWPGAPEQCDGTDNDCDGQIDDGLHDASDEDGDGFVAGGAREDRCEPSPSGVRIGDCQDQDAAIHPGANDPPGDGIDQDCGGTQEADPHVGLNERSFVSLQVAIDAALPGATVWVGPGTWLEHDLTFRGRALTLASTDGPKATSIDADGQGRVMIFDQGETSATVVSGFTLRGGLAQGPGGGIYVEDSHPSLEHLVITDNQSVYDGGGLYAIRSRLVLRDSEVVKNSASLSSEAMSASAGIQGGGAALVDSDATLTRCVFRYNRASARAEAGDRAFASAVGGGLAIVSGRPALTGCQWIGNSAQAVASGVVGEAVALGGGLAVLSSSPVITNARLVENVASAEGYGETTGPDETADALGGGIYLEETRAALTHLWLQSNRVTGKTPDYSGTYSTGVVGGGGLCSQRGAPALRHVVVLGNSGLVDTRGDNDAAAPGGGLYLLAGSVTLLNSILAYNPGDNLYVEPEATLELTSSDLYNPPGSGNHNLPALDASNLVLEPGFLAYDEAGLPTDLHLAGDSPLVDAGSEEERDVDGTRADPGIYGGGEGDDWDLDGDGARAYFWPGGIDDAPAGFDPADYDCDDSDPEVAGVTNGACIP